MLCCTVDILLRLTSEKDAAALLDRLPHFSMWTDVCKYYQYGASAQPLLTILAEFYHPSGLKTQGML